MSYCVLLQDYLSEASGIFCNIEGWKRQYENCHQKQFPFPYSIICVYSEYPNIGPNNYL